MFLPDPALLPGAIHTPLPDARRSESIPPHISRLSLLCQTVYQRLAEAGQVEIDYGHIFLWSPVLLGGGAAWSFSLTRAPAAMPLVSISVLAALVWLFAGPLRPLLRSVLAGIFLFCTGALLAHIELMRTPTVLLDTAVTTTVRATILGREIDSEGRWRYRLQIISTHDPTLKRPPSMVKITAKENADTFLPGVTIEGRARLSPPSGPALVGSNDFAFDAYFDGAGAFGYFYGNPSVVRAEQNPSITSAISRQLELLRQVVGGRIRAVLPGDTGAFASSMITDDRRAISNETTEALRRSGLAHIVAISGLNMALAAGLFFVGFRLLFSLSQRISHGWPVKKLAALGALFTVTGYYLISGFAVSAERAYIMMAIILVAAIFGRKSISLRNVALSANIILVSSPSAVMGPGFQMSYAATLALVVGYSAWQRKIARAGFSLGIFERFAPVIRFFGGVFMTSLVGGLSTALFSIEYFHRLSTWGLPANLLAMPVISFIVMPAGLLALLLMPFGLDWVPLILMGYGLDLVIAIAKWAASQSGDLVTGRIPGWFFVSGIAGLLLLALFRSALKHSGFVVLLLALALIVFLPSARKPDLVLFEDGQLAAALTQKELLLNQTSPSVFVIQQWQRALNTNDPVEPLMLQGMEKAPRKGKLDSELKMRISRQMRETLETAVAGRFSCVSGQWCVYRHETGYTLVMAINGALTGTACDIGDLVVTPAKLKWSSCRSGAVLYTGDTLRRSGTVEVFLPHDGDKAKPVFEHALQDTTQDWALHRYYDWRSDTYNVPKN